MKTTYRKFTCDCPDCKGSFAYPCRETELPPVAGEWTARPCTNTDGPQIPGAWIVEMAGGGWVAIATAKSTAILIASAPRLNSELTEAVDALRELLACCVPTDMDTRTDRAMSAASKIVAKHKIV